MHNDAKGLPSAHVGMVYSWVSTLLKASIHFRFLYICTSKRSRSWSTSIACNASSGRLNSLTPKSFTSILELLRNDHFSVAQRQGVVNSVWNDSHSVRMAVRVPQPDVAYLQKAKGKRHATSPPNLLPAEFHAKIPTELDPSRFPICAFYQRKNIAEKCEYFHHGNLLFSCFDFYSGR